MQLPPPVGATGCTGNCVMGVQDDVLAGRMA